MGECCAYEECEFNGQPECRLPDGMKCPHGVKADKPTNADRIRAMSDDELLELIEEIRIHCCPPLCDQNHYCDEDCHKGIAAWLNGPADERILAYLKRPKMKEGASEGTSP